MVPCPHCQAPLFGNPARCHKCGQPVSVDDRSPAEKARKAERAREDAARRQDPATRKRYARLIDALNAGKAGIASQGGIQEGEAGWAAFLDLGAFTALPCSSCGYALLRAFSPSLDASWIVRGTGTAGADNWVAFFVCPKCGTEHRGQKVTVSHDLNSKYTKEGDPVGQVFGRRPWWKPW